MRYRVLCVVVQGIPKNLVEHKINEIAGHYRNFVSPVVTGWNNCLTFTVMPECSEEGYDSHNEMTQIINKLTDYFTPLGDVVLTSFGGSPEAAQIDFDSRSV